MSSDKQQQSNFLNMICSGAASLFVGFFSGPYVSEFFRKSYETYYEMMYGAPSLLSPSYYWSYIPMRGHIQYYGYLLGPMIFTAVLWPMFYKLMQLISGAIQGTYGNGISPELDERLGAIEQQLNALHQAQQASSGSRMLQLGEELQSLLQDEAITSNPAALHALTQFRTTLDQAVEEGRFAPSAPGERLRRPM